jgi:hypothetical protein
MIVFADIITPWTGDGTEDDPNRPRLMDNYRFGFTDKTGQPSGALPPQPNIFVINVKVEDTVLAQIDADAEYYVLWEGDEQDASPGAQEFGQLRAYLGQQGMDQEDINAAIGQSANGRTRLEITDDLITWLKSLHL